MPFSLTRILRNFRPRTRLTKWLAQFTQAHSLQSPTALLDLSPLPVLIVRMDDQRVHYANPRAAECFNLPPQALIGRFMPDFYDHPEVRHTLMAALHHHGQIENFEAELHDAHGQCFTALITARQFVLDGVAMSFATFSNITKRARAWARSASAEQELRQLLEHAPIPIMITRKEDGAGLFANHCALTLMDMTAASFAQERASDYYFDLIDRARILETLEREGRINGFEVRLQNKGLRPVWGLLTIGATRYEDQDALMTIFTNISERKEMERALQISEERHRFLAENTADVVWQLDQDLCFTYINESDQRLRGFSREEVLGQHVLAVYPPVSHAVIHENIRQRMAQENQGIVTSHIQFVAQQICKDGHLIWMETSSSPVRNDKGEIVGYNGVSRDISKRYEDSQAMSAANQQLAEQLQQIRQLEAALREQLVHDPLTGLFNRRYLDDAVGRELARARREHLPVSFVMLDIDHFKEINDTYGHLAGDEALRALARLLRENSRSSDIICRFGGEEFLLILPSLCLQDAFNRAEVWRTQLAETNISFQHKTFRITLSAGLSAFPCNGDTIDDLLRYSDKALYRAKQNGRNQTCLYAESSRITGTIEHCCHQHIQD